MKVLITGANGMIAKAVSRHCRLMGDDILPLTRQELDISDKDKVLTTIEKHSPTAIFNCAAYTDVDGAETNPDTCYETNSIGVENLALAAQSVNSAFVTISTDYIFDGLKKGFYSEEDRPNPQSVYAKSKLEGEIRAREAYPGSVVVRTGWVFGFGGTNFLSAMPKLLAGGTEIKAIYDAFGTPTFADDLAMRLRELASLDFPGTYHVTNRGPGTSFAGFAQTVCGRIGVDLERVQLISEKELARAAQRPANSKLSCLMIKRAGLAPLPDWEDSLTAFLKT